MDRIGNYEEQPFGISRQNISLISREGRRKLTIHSLLELDVSQARNIIQKQKQKGVDISFTAWVVKCVAQAVSEHRIINSYRQGRKKIVTFQDVDIPLPVERMVNNKTHLLTYIIRKANEKTVDEITQEIRTIQNESITDATQLLGKDVSRLERRIINAPFFIKKIVIRIVRHNGLLKKKHFGTVGVTSIGMKGVFPGWVIPMGGPVAALCVLGGIRKKPGVWNDTIEIREYLHMTVTCDHELVDGGPLVRFVSRLTELVENAYALQKDTS